MALAFFRERVSLPVRAATLQRHSGHLRHQVTLGRPDVADVARFVPDRSARLPRVVVGSSLSGDEVERVEAHVSAADVERRRNLAGREREVVRGGDRTRLA